MSRILDRELATAPLPVVRPRLPSLFEPGLLRLRTDLDVETDDVRRERRPGGGRDDERAGDPTATAAGPTRGGRAPDQPSPLRTGAPSDSSPSVGRPVVVPTGNGSAEHPAAGTRSRAPEPGGETAPAHVAGGARTTPQGHAPPLPAAVDEERRDAGHPRRPVRPTPTTPADHERRPVAVAVPARARARPQEGRRDGEARPASRPDQGLVPPPTPLAPVVRITIGRVEVRSGRSEEPRPEAATPAPRRTPRLTLSEYLDRREDGRRP